MSQFPALAAGCVLYLTSPSLVCSAAQQGKWGVETDRFLHKITHGDHHEHKHEGSELHVDHAHEHVDIHGLKVLFGDLRDHYEPISNEVSTKLQTIFKYS